MKCMCPNCGEKINSEELVFDFTDFINNNLKEYMLKIGTEQFIKDAAEQFFNVCGGIRFTESELWNYSSLNDSNTKVSKKTIIFTIPVELIKTIAESIDSEFVIQERPQDVNYENVKEVMKQIEVFCSWLKDNKENIEIKEYEILLFKEGDGDIKFNRIPGVAEERRCPFCHEKMSYWAGRYEEWTLTVLGGPRVSKTTAVTSCIAAFMQGGDENILFMGVDDDSGYKNFKEECLSLYEDGFAVGATKNEANDKIPRVSFRVSLNGRKSCKKKEICLTFVDVPGELNGENGISEEMHKRYHKIFSNIDFVWYCTDIGEIQQLTGMSAERLGRDDKQPVSTSRIKSNMEKLSSYFRDNKREVPVAYIIGKTDDIAISDKDKEKYGLYDISQKETKLPFDVNEFFKRSRKVREYIQLINPELIAVFERSFASRCYIATSAYGYSPKKKPENQDTSINKDNITDSFHRKEAFLWMLAIKGLIEICVDNEAPRSFRKIFGRGKYNEEEIDFMENFSPSTREKLMRKLYMRASYLN